MGTWRRCRHQNSFWANLQSFSHKESRALCRVALSLGLKSDQTSTLRYHVTLIMKIDSEVEVGNVTISNSKSLDPPYLNL